MNVEEFQATMVLKETQCFSIPCAYKSTQPLDNITALPRYIILPHQTMFAVKFNKSTIPVGKFVPFIFSITCIDADGIGKSTANNNKQM